MAKHSKMNDKCVMVFQTINNQTCPHKCSRKINERMIRTDSSVYTCTGQVRHEFDIDPKKPMLGQQQPPILLGNRLPRSN